MSVLVGKHARLVVQGMSGSAGAFHARQMLEYGTKLVAGVTPGRGGSRVEGLEKIPMFDTVDDAVAQAGANTTVIYVPPAFAADAILEAAAAGVKLIITITEGIPVADMATPLTIMDRVLDQSGASAKLGIHLVRDKAEWERTPGRWLGGDLVNEEGHLAGEFASGFFGPAAASAVERTAQRWLALRAERAATSALTRGGSGLSHAARVLEGGTGRALAGHGELRLGAGEVTIPEGTTLTIWTKEGQALNDTVGRLVEAGRYGEIAALEAEGARSLLPGATLPNYTLKAPDGLTVFRNSTTVEDATSLRDLLKAGMGHVDWAACLLFRCSK